MLAMFTHVNNSNKSHLNDISQLGPILHLLLQLKSTKCCQQCRLGKFRINTTTGRKYSSRIHNNHRRAIGSSEQFQKIHSQIKFSRIIILSEQTATVSYRLLHNLRTRQDCALVVLCQCLIRFVLQVEEIINHSSK